MNPPILANTPHPKILILLDALPQSTKSTLVQYGHHSDFQLEDFFCGSTGMYLKNLLTQSGLLETDLTIRTVFPFVFPQGKFDSFCGKKAEVGGKAYTKSGLAPGKYLRPEYFKHLTELYSHLAESSYDLIIPMGVVATWALLDNPKLKSLRGYVQRTPYGTVLPTYNAAVLFKQYELFLIIIADLKKALRYARQPDQQLTREFTIAESPQEILDWIEQIPSDAILTFDIETIPSKKWITCIGFADSPQRALVIPFVNQNNSSYWANPADELQAWKLARDLLEGPHQKAAQNGIYDIEFLYATMKIKVKNFKHDTMLAHHVLYAELPRSLHFLGSIYANDMAWKQLAAFTEDKGEDAA